MNGGLTKRLQSHAKWQRDGIEALQNPTYASKFLTQHYWLHWMQFRALQSVYLWSKHHVKGQIEAAEGSSCKFSKSTVLQRGWNANQQQHGNLDAWTFRGIQSNKTQERDKDMSQTKKHHRPEMTRLALREKSTIEEIVYTTWAWPAKDLWPKKYVTVDLALENFEALTSGRRSCT